MTASAAPSADDDILDYTIPLVLSRPLPQGVTFSDFAGEVFEDARADEPANQQVGAGWLRLSSADWNATGISTHRPADDKDYDWNDADRSGGSNPDTDVINAHSQGQEVLVDLAYIPSWAYSTACKNASVTKKFDVKLCAYYAPENLGDWTAYVTAAVAHYSAPPFNVRYFQIWNELNGPGFWNITNDGNAYQEFTDQIYNPAAAIIHSFGGRVVFAGWTCDIGNSTWKVCENQLNTALSYNGMGANSDYIDLHYAPVSAPVPVWQDISQKWLNVGTVRGVWQSEIGGNFPTGLQPAPLTPTYLKALYWALSVGAGNWNSNTPDRYKFFWLAGNYCGTIGTLTIGQIDCNNPRPPGSALTLAQNGIYHAVLSTVLGGGYLSAYNGYTSTVPGLGFLVGQNKIAIGLFPTVPNTPMELSIPLSSQARSVTLINADGSSVFESSSQSGGILTVYATTGSTLPPAYLLSIQF